MHGFTTNKYLRGVGQARVALAPAAADTNLTATSRNGSTVTADSTEHTKGAYTELIAATATDTFALYVGITDVALGNNNTSILLDIAVGAASSEVVIIPNINAGYASLHLSGQASFGKTFMFPGLFIPSGSRIAVRSQAVIASDTCVVRVHAAGALRYSISQTTVIAYGADTANSRGTSVPAGTSGYGAWTEIADTTRDHLAWTVGIDGLADTAFANESDALVQIGYGPNSGAVTPIGTTNNVLASGEAIAGPFPYCFAAAVPNGSKLWARIASDEAGNRGVIIYGI